MTDNPALEINNLLRLTKEGDKDATMLVGLAYKNGNGVKKNLALAVEHLLRAADAGQAHANCELGILYNRGEGVPKNPVEGARRLRIAAECGEQWAQVELGLIYTKGLNTPKDYHEALKWFSRAAQQGNQYGLMGLGTAHKEGWGVAANYAEAKNCFEKAIATGALSAEELTQLNRQINDLSRQPRFYITDDKGKRHYEGDVITAMVASWIWTISAAIALFLTRNIHVNGIISIIMLLCLLCGPTSLFLDVPRYVKILREKRYRLLDQVDAALKAPSASGVQNQQPHGHSDYDEGSI